MQLKHCLFEKNPFFCYNEFTGRQNRFPQDVLREKKREENRMFDTMNVAKIIKQKRMEKNLTQMQLADALGISYQAVSNWERGNSMPDISKLGELSEILDCPVEELLGNDNKAKVVEDIIKGENPENVSLDMEELAEVAPILPPKQTESILGQMIGELETVQLSELCGLAPFLTEETLEQLAEKVSGESCFLEELCGIAPFLSKQSLDRLVKKAISQNKEGIEFDEICGLAPFLSKETLDDIVTLAIEREDETDLEELVGLCPFLSKQTIQRIAGEMLKQGGLESLAAIAPFIR